MRVQNAQLKSKRVASVIKDADDLLKLVSKAQNLDHFDTFSRNLLAELKCCFQGDFSIVNVSGKLFTS